VPDKVPQDVHDFPRICAQPRRGRADDSTPRKLSPNALRLDHQGFSFQPRKKPMPSAQSVAETGFRWT
jgi:hypothetical protein